MSHCDLFDETGKNPSRFHHSGAHLKVSVVFEPEVPDSERPGE